MSGTCYVNKWYFHAVWAAWLVGDISPACIVQCISGNCGYIGYPGPGCVAGACLRSGGLTGTVGITLDGWSTGLLSPGVPGSSGGSRRSCGGRGYGLGSALGARGGSGSCGGRGGWSASSAVIPCGSTASRLCCGAGGLGCGRGWRACSLPRCGAQRAFPSVHRICGGEIKQWLVLLCSV